MMNKKTIKYNSIKNNPNKKLLRLSLENYEIDSFIEKSADKQALSPFMDIHYNNFYAKFYNHTMKGFSNKYVIATNVLEINTIPMNNGGKNNLLYRIVDQNKLFNCYAYIFSAKGTWENKHRILRRIFYKGESLDSLH